MPGFSGVLTAPGLLTELEDLFAQFPGLCATPHKITSGPSDEYNCVAWVQNDMDHFWDPDQTWPDQVDPPTDPHDDLDAYLALFRWMGFEECATGELEPGYLKIAVYSATHPGLGDPRHEFSHVARQLPSGRWSSKGGVCHDFRHDELEPLEGAGALSNAVVTHFMRRRDEGSHPLTQAAEEGLLSVDETPLTLADLGSPENHTPDP